MAIAAVGTESDDSVRPELAMTVLASRAVSAGPRYSSTIPAMVRSGTAAHLIDYHPATTIDRNWTALAVHRLEADSHRSADTHLVRLPLSGPVDLYLKDESTHPTGSLKHRLARSLFLYALCNGWIGPTTTVVEASSGSTAVSEAYFARLIGVPFVAVMSRSTSPAKIALIKREGGRCHLIEDPAAVSDVAAQLARELDGHFLDQFTYAERATDWRGNNNIAESTLAQMALEPHSVPSWIVVGAGTGGTAATFGRYLRLRGTTTRLCVVDPEGSAFLPSYQGQLAESAGSRIEGIGRPRVEPSFVPSVIDRMLGVPDGASVATMRFLNHRLGISAGPSTGTNVFGALRLACEMCADQAAGSIVTLMCDSGARYTHTYDDDAWLNEQGININPYLPVVVRAWDDKVWDCA
jgi:cysteine synthase